MNQFKPVNAPWMFEQLCRYCQEYKPYTTEFFRAVFGTQTPGRICIKCANAHANSRKFGLSYQERKTKLAKVTKCPICLVDLKPRIQGVKGAKLRDIAVIDHNHKTGKFRGILCNNCNRGIGLLGDSAQNLERAITYLNSLEGG